MTPRAHAFESRFERSAGCWLWTGSVSKSTGYGVMSWHQQREYAHRFSFAIHFRSPGSLLVCHTCDVRTCVNPAHLFLGTISDNINDMWSKGRGRTPAPRAGSFHHAAKLNEVDVRSILNRIATGEHQDEIATSLNVSPSTISLIRKGRTWKHVDRSTSRVSL